MGEGGRGRGHDDGDGVDDGVKRDTLLAWDMRMVNRPLLTPNQHAPTVVEDTQRMVDLGRQQRNWTEEPTMI